LKTDIIYEIFKQAMVIVKSLTLYNFFHRDINSNTLLFFSDYCSYIYDNVYVDCPITLKISDLSLSSITINNEIRLYNQSNIIDEEIEKMQYKILLNIIDEINFCSKNNTYNFKNIINNFQKYTIYIYLMNLGIPMFQSSLNVYIIMIILMSYINFYNEFIKSDKLMSIWKKMWNIEDYNILMENIKELHKDINSTSHLDKIMKFLSNYQLKCDVLDLIWSDIIN